MKVSRMLLWLAVVWAIVFSVPGLRDAARVQLMGSDVLGFAVWPRKIHWRFLIPKSRWKTLSQRNPHNIFLAIERVETQFISENENGDYYESYYVSPPGGPGAALPPNSEYQLRQRALRKSYDGLLRSFPKTSLRAFLLAQRLDYTLNWMAPRRIAGALSPYYAGTDRRKGRDNFSQRDVEIAIGLCREGQMLEPNNAFFDWALCKFLLMLRRDDRVLRVLAAAKNKTRYDDHKNDLQRVLIKAHEIALGRPLLHEEKVRVLTQSHPGHYEYYDSPEDNFAKEALSILAWKSLCAARRGDHAFALQWAEYSMRVAALIRKSGDFKNNYSYAQDELNLQNQLARGLMAKNGRSLTLSRNPKNRLTFQNYAAAHGRPDVAQLAKKNAAEANAMATSISSISYRQSGLYGFAPFPAAILTLTWLAGVLLLFSIAGTLPGLMIVSLLLRWRRIQSRLMTQTPIPVSRCEVIGGVLACSGLRAILAAIAAGIGGGLCALLAMFLFVPQDEIGRALSDFQKTLTGPSFAADFLNACTGIWSGIGTAFNSGDEIPLFFRFIAALLPFLLGAFYAQWRAVHQQRLQNGEGPEPRFWQFIRGISDGRFFRADLVFDFSRAFIKLFDWLLFLVSLAAWIVFAFMPYDSDYWWIAVLAIALGLSGAVTFFNFLRWRRRSNRRAAVSFHFQLLRASLWGWLIVASTLYFLLLLISIPLRNRADAALDRVLKPGEIKASQSKS